MAEPFQSPDGMAFFSAEQDWKTVQVPRCPAYMPTGTMLLLSALDNGWLIENIELTPSWDQYGFVYLVSLRCKSDKFSQQIILLKNHLVEDLLNDAAGSLFNQPVYDLQGMHA